MGKTLQIKTIMAVGSVLFLALSIGVLFNQPARAFDAKATPIMLNRTAIAMGPTDKAENIFYDKDTANDNYVWQNISDGCYSDITRESVPANPDAGTGGGYKWVLRASTKLGDGSCSPEKTSTLSEPKNYDEREFVVFYRNNSDVINSVKADVDNPFINTGISPRGGASAIYIEKDEMDPYDCPSLIVDQKSPDGWMYVMMRRANNESDASKQYAALIRELAARNFFATGIQSGDFTDDNAICEVIPADTDDEKESVLAYYGLPGSYYNTRANDENREQVDLDYDGANLGGFDLHTMYGMDATGMSLSGPLRGGFIESGELEAGGGENPDLGPTCSAGALGWVLCPLSEAIVSATESIAGILEELLTFQPLTTGEQGNAIRAIWGTLLGVANAGLVIAFLVIVFSQATSIGLSSYGIKKLLPRVIAAAILMNLSFYICAAAVDISNILGVSIKSIVDVGIEQVTASSNNPDLYTGAGGMQWIAVIVAATLAAAIAVATGAIFLLLPVLVAGLMAVFTALIIIAARQVLITLLIIVAPLAILAWILPNTEQWFTKWRKLFTLLLLMFPLVMAIFYGSVLVSNVILAAAGNSGSGLNDFTIKLLAFLVLIVPLFSLPFVIKSVGGIMDRLGIIVNNRNKGVVDRTRKKAGEWQGRSSYQRGKELRKRAADEYRGTKFANRLGRGGRTGFLARGVAGNIGQLPGARDSNFGAQANRLGDYAIQAERKAASERREAIRSRFVNEGTSMSNVAQAYQRAVESGDVDTAAASFKHLSTTFGGGGRTAAAQALQDTDLSVISDETKRQKMATEMDELIGGELYGSLVNSRVDIAKGGFRGGNSYSFKGVNDLTAPQLATQDGDVYDRATTRGETVNADEAYLAMTNPDISGKITDGDTRQHLSTVSGVPVRQSGAGPIPPATPPAGSPPPPPPPPPPAGGGGGTP